MTNFDKTLKPSSRRRKQRGAAAMVEFVLASLMLVPIALGTIAVGFGLTRYIQVGSVCRSAASMFVRGADFTQTSYQKVLGKISLGLGMADTNGNIRTNGNGVVIFSVIMRVGDAECAGGGFGLGDTRCANRYKAVVTRRIVVGNQSLRNSRYATPIGGTRSAEGTYAANFYLTDASAAVPRFGTAVDNGGVVSTAPLRLAAGEITYLAETFFTAPDINIFPRVLNLPGFYHYNFF